MANRTKSNTESGGELQLLAGVWALVLAPDRAPEMYRDPREATRSQIVMLILMVVFTCLGLWLLSAALNT